MKSGLSETATAGLLERESERIAVCCEAMAERFEAGGTLVVLAGQADASDAAHIAVEFVHPVIVGKRALPALAHVGEGAAVATGVSERDIVLGLQIAGEDPAVATAFERAAGAGALPIAIGSGEDGFELPGRDAWARQELAETLYHVLWELVHVFLEAGESASLLPWMGGGTAASDLREAAAASAAAKGRTAGELRAASLARNDAAIDAAAAALRDRFAAGGRLLAFGNGGSATDSQDVVSDLAGRGRPALDLAAEPSILSAIANDVGAQEIFSRQLIAHARDGDAVLAISTSGSSENLISALTEARRRSLVSVAVLGYDGGRIAAEGLADHLLIVESEEIPRIQEAQGTLLHELLRRES